MTVCITVSCICGTYWSKVPPPPCPVHRAPALTQPYPMMSPKELADLYRRIADTLDPPTYKDSTEG